MGLFSKKEASSSGASIPQAPPVNQAGINQFPEPIKNIKNLSTPPLPGGSLEDIKNQVAGTQASQPMNTQLNMGIPEMDMHEDNMDMENNDSLFDFSDIEINSPVESEQTFTPLTTPATQEVKYNESELKFLEDKKHKINTDETYFVTTRQFKSLLEIVENVKNRVKEASETHLRLLDMKAEEDIEYENLRKDFEFIESKLYEVDGIIFDK